MAEISRKGHRATPAEVAAMILDKLHDDYDEYSIEVSSTGGYGYRVSVTDNNNFSSATLTEVNRDEN